MSHKEAASLCKRHRGRKNGPQSHPVPAESPDTNAHAQGQVTVPDNPLLQGNCQVVIMHGTSFSFSVFQLGLESIIVPCHLLHAIIILHQAAFLKCGSPRVAGER